MTTSESNTMTEPETTAIDLLEFSGKRSVPLILQAEIAECGLASVAMVANYHGHKLDMAALRKRFTADLKGMNLQQMIDLGDKLGLASRALKCPIEEVGKLALPCVLHWDMNIGIYTKCSKFKQSGIYRELFKKTTIRSAN